MKSNDFYNEFHKNIKDMGLDQLKDVIDNVIRKIPGTKYDEVLSIFDKKIDAIEKQKIKSKMKKYKEKFRQIDEFELCFYATGYEDYGEYYTPWGGDWIWEYTDKDNIGHLIKEATGFAIELTNKRQYREAKELFDIILNTNYQVMDEDGGDNFEISLTELMEKNLIYIDVDMLCLYSIYVTYQNSNKADRSKKIYQYFKNENFQNISVENSFTIGTEMLKETEQFWNDWICLLLRTAENIAYRLLKEAFEYNNYNNYQKYINEIGKNHPKIYIDLFQFLVKENRIKEIINIGNKALLLLDENLVVRNEIALYLAEYDLDNKEKYIVEALKSNTNVPNLLRVINNNYFEKNKKEIEHIIHINDNSQTHFSTDELTKNLITQEDYNYLKFFVGDFDEFFNECLKVQQPVGWSDSFIQYGVYLWLLYFNGYKESKVYKVILSETFHKLGFKENLLFLDNEYGLVFHKWKQKFKLSDSKKYLKWLQSIIDVRVDIIISNGYRNSYYKAARLIVALGEALESNDVQSKEEFINLYHKRYSRRSSFRKELNKYM